MTKRLLFAGHTRVFNPRNLDFILSDTPKCQGRKELRLCSYANRECKKSCYESTSYSCPVHSFLDQVKNYHNRPGACLR